MIDVKKNNFDYRLNLNVTEVDEKFGSQCLAFATYVSSKTNIYNNVADDTKHQRVLIKDHVHYLLFNAFKHFQMRHGQEENSTNLCIMLLLSFFRTGKTLKELSNEVEIAKCWKDTIKELGNGENLLKR